MKYIQNTDKDIKEMLKEIGVKSFEDLIKIIPDDIRFKNKFKIGEGLSEYEFALAASEMKKNN